MMYSDLTVLLLGTAYNLEVWFPFVKNHTIIYLNKIGRNFELWSFTAILLLVLSLKVMTIG